MKWESNPSPLPSLLFQHSPPLPSFHYSSLYFPLSLPFLSPSPLLSFTSPFPSFHSWGALSAEPKSKPKWLHFLRQTFCVLDNFSNLQHFSEPRMRTANKDRNNFQINTCSQRLTFLHNAAMLAWRFNARKLHTRSQPDSGR